MTDHRSKPDLQKKAKDNLLSDLEDLSGMLDDESTEIERELTQPYDLEDLPVLKSFVEDVPTLSEKLSGDEGEKTNKTGESPAKPATPTHSSGIDDSFVDDDPLAISSAVRQQRAGGTAPQPPGTGTEKPQLQSHSSTSAPTPSPAPAKAAEPAKTPRSDNPFLPKSALDRIKNDASGRYENKASQELRDLVRQRSLPNFSTNSKEYQALRNDASKMVNEVIKLFIPRIEAELRMRLEKEIDEFLKELRNNAKD